MLNYAFNICIVGVLNYAPVVWHAADLNQVRRELKKRGYFYLPQN